MRWTVLSLVILAHVEGTREPESSQTFARNLF
jgi:hypothetical protein